MNKQEKIEKLKTPGTLGLTPKDMMVFGNEKQTLYIVLDYYKKYERERILVFIFGPNNRKQECQFECFLDDEIIG